MAENYVKQHKRKMELKIVYLKYLLYKYVRPKQTVREREQIKTFKEAKRKKENKTLKSS